MIVLQGSMPNKCKRCKESGGLEDGLHLIHTEEDYVNFYCDGQSPKTCPIIGEIPDKHGDLIDRDKLLDWKNDNITFVSTGCWQSDYEAVKVPVIKRAPVILEASK